MGFLGFPTNREERGQKIETSLAKREYSNLKAMHTFLQRTQELKYAVRKEDVVNYIRNAVDRVKEDVYLEFKRLGSGGTFIYKSKIMALSDETIQDEFVRQLNRTFYVKNEMIGSLKQLSGQAKQLDLKAFVDETYAICSFLMNFALTYFKVVEKFEKTAKLRNNRHLLDEFVTPLKKNIEAYDIAKRSLKN